MKKNKFKLIALMIAIVMVAALLGGVLAACNNGDDGNDDGGSDGNLPISNSEIDAYIGYVLSEAKNGNEAEVYFVSISDEYFNSVQDDEDIPYYTGYISIGFYNEETEEQAWVAVYFCASNDEANAFYEYIMEDEDEDEGNCYVDGNNLIYESEEGLYENTVLKAEIPSNSISDKRLDFIKETINAKYTNYAETYFYYSARYNEEQLYDYFDGEVYPLVGNCSTVIGFVFGTMDEAEALIGTYYTADSYVDINNKEGGYSFYRLTSKPGFIFDDGPDGENVCYIHVYFYDTETVESLVIPETDGNGNTVTMVNLDSIPVKSLTIPTSVTYLWLYEFKELETINYAGTVQQWEELTEYSSWFTYWEYDENGSHKVELHFTVHCSNGDITYPLTED